MKIKLKYGKHSKKWEGEIKLTIGYSHYRSGKLKYVLGMFISKSLWNKLGKSIKL